MCELLGMLQFIHAWDAAEECFLLILKRSLRIWQIGLATVAVRILNLFFADYIPLTQNISIPQSKK